jgi:hypothetical protein
MVSQKLGRKKCTQANMKFQRERSNIALHFISQFLSQDFARRNDWDLVDEVNCMKPFVKHNLH